MSTSQMNGQGSVVGALVELVSLGSLGSLVTLVASLSPAVIASLVLALDELGPAVVGPELSVVALALPSLPCASEEPGPQASENARGAARSAACAKLGDRNITTA